MSTKTCMYLLDTNILIHDPYAWKNFEGCTIAIPMTVVQELETFKKESSQRGYTAREAIRFLDGLREQGSLSQGIQVGKNVTIAIIPTPDSLEFHGGFDPSLPDDIIILTAKYLQDSGRSITLVSQDLSVRVKANILGIPALDYALSVDHTSDVYRGWRTVEVPAVELKKEEPLILQSLTESLYPNEFIILQSQHNEYHTKLFRYVGGNKFVFVPQPSLVWPIQPRNIEQTMALNLLLDDSVQLVTLSGSAGTGKTFLALVAALHKILIENAYEKVMITRPVIPLGPDMGYLPGDLQEKLHSWMQPIRDNMDFIVHQAQHVEHLTPNEYHKSRSRGSKKSSKRQGEPRSIPGLDQLMQSGKVSLEAITYMRGRSIPYQYIFIDEVQNLNPHEVKTIVSRVGEGSKIILAGDPYQIDSPYLDFKTNGLVVATERFKGQNIFGTVFLKKSERSLLSQLAGELL